MAASQPGATQAIRIRHDHGAIAGPQRGRLRTHRIRLGTGLQTEEFQTEGERCLKPDDTMMALSRSLFSYLQGDVPILISADRELSLENKMWSEV
jgi:hypothetical protein